jgi:uncharacterized lipoprotein YajG
VKQLIPLWLIFVGVGLLAGCAGKGETVMLNVQAVPPKQVASAPQPPLKVVVIPFEDLRAEKGWLGTRTHLWGGTTHFNVAGGPIGDVVARVLVDHLRQHGLEASMSAGPPMEQKPDVTIKAQIQDLLANAKSAFGSTEITVRVKVALQAQNAADGSTARLALNGAGVQRVFWFEHKDVQKLLNEVLQESFEKLMADMKFENRTLQVR